MNKYTENNNLYIRILLLCLFIWSLKTEYGQADPTGDKKQTSDWSQNSYIGNREICQAARADEDQRAGKQQYTCNEGDSRKTEPPIKTAEMV